MAYTPLTWVEGVTTLGPTNMNHIEGGIQTADANATSALANAPTAAVVKSVVTTAGDLIYATGNAAVTRLGIGSTTQVLKGGASAPTWGSVAYSELTGTPTLFAGPGVPVTTLPGSPTNGQQAILTDSTSAPTYLWLLQWSSTAAKWLCIGGSPAITEVLTSETTASTGYAALATAGPSFTVPNAGDYYVTIGATILVNGNILCAMSYDIGGTGAVDADSIQVQASGATNGGANSRTRVKTLAASTALVSKYKTSALTPPFMNRYMMVMPRSVT